MLKKLRDKNRHFNSLYNSSFVASLKQDDIISFNMLSPLLIGYPFLPITGGALRPFCLAYILNDIVINNRTNIIEFGSGISTVLIARLKKLNNLDISFTSVDHDLNWNRTLKKMLAEEGTSDDHINLVHAPLESCKESLNGTQWYSWEKLEETLAINSKAFDMVIIDGPPAHKEENKFARYPTVPFIINKLSDRYSIFLDDVNREGEKNILEQWKMKYNLNFKIHSTTLAVNLKGDSFGAIPLLY